MLDDGQFKENRFSGKLIFIRTLSSRVIFKRFVVDIIMSVYDENNNK